MSLPSAALSPGELAGLKLSWRRRGWFESNWRLQVMVFGPLVRLPKTGYDSGLISQKGA